MNKCSSSILVWEIIGTLYTTYSNSTFFFYLALLLYICTITITISFTISTTISITKKELPQLNHVRFIFNRWGNFHYHCHHYYYYNLYTLYYPIGLDLNGFFIFSSCRCRDLFYYFLSLFKKLYLELNDVYCHKI